MFNRIYQLLFCILFLQPISMIGMQINHGTSLPSRSPRAFAKKVDAFINKMYTTVSSNTYTVKRLKGILREIKKCKSERDCIKIILSARKTYGADAQSNEYKQVWSALLVAVVQQLGIFAQKRLIHILDELERRITFWEEQQGHSLRYFFHKNPLRWFYGKSQKKEVKDNIRTVYKKQQQYLSHLGQLTQHMDSFNENSSITQQHTWVIQILRVIHMIVCPNSKDKQFLEEQTLNKRITKVMMTILSALPKHKQEVEKELYVTQPSNHFVRNWMWYTALTAGALWTYRNWNGKVGEWRSWISNGTHNFYTNHLERPFNDICALFSSVDHSRHQDFFTSAEQLYRDHAQLNNEAVNEEDFNNFMHRLRNGDMNAIDDIRRWCLDLLPDDLNGNIRTIINRVDVHVNHFRNQVNNNENRSRIPGMLGGSYITAMNRVRTAVDNFNNLLGGLQGEMQAINITRENPLSRRLRLLVDAYAYVANQMYEKQRLNVVLLAAIPTVAVSVGGYFGLRGLYRYLRPVYTFAPMKKALSEISRVLNWYEERPAPNMSTIDYGTLLYFVHKLKIDAKYIAKQNTRARFLRDVKELELPQFTERQKMHTVTRIYREYDFLAV